jgi:hypothetical protein
MAEQQLASAMGAAARAREEEPGRDVAGGGQGVHKGGGCSALLRAILRAILGQFWGQFGANLGPFPGHFRAISGPFGALLEFPRALSVALRRALFRVRPRGTGLGGGAGPGRGWGWDAKGSKDIRPFKIVNLAQHQKPLHEVKVWAR